jgi:hypothetical protein
MNKKLLFATVAAVSIVGAESLLTVDKVFAKESANRSYNSMTAMMKTYDGDNWKQVCTEMTNNLDEST